MRWVPIRNIHLTLKFLGDVSVANTNMLAKMIEAATGSHAVFDMSVGGLGAFPSQRRPRVVWVGVEAPKELKAIQRSIDNETARMGYEADTRPYSPHLTLARVARNARAQDVREISNVLEATKIGFLGATRVTQVHLYRSDLQPGGAVYTRVFSASLQEQSL